MSVTKIVVELLTTSQKKKKVDLPKLVALSTSQLLSLGEKQHCRQTNFIYNKIISLTRY